MCLSLVLVVLDNTVTNVAIPTLASELDATGEELAWIVDAYTLTFGALLLTMGAMGDRFGRRLALQVGLAVVGVSSLSALLATSAEHLIAIRVVMGMGAALVMPATLSIIVEVFPPEERGKAIAAWTGVAGAGAAIGLLLGGWLLEHFAWQSVFTINAPIAALALVLGALIVPETRDPTTPPVDRLGTVLSVVTLGSLLYAIIQTPAYGTTDARVVWAAVVAVVGGLAFAIHETRTPHPMLPLRLFRDRGFSAGAVAISLTFFAMFAIFFVLSQYMQSIRGYSPLETGVRFLPLVFGIGFAAVASEWLVRKAGPALVIGGGLLSVATALLALSTIDAHTDYALVALMFVGVGIGMGLIMPPATALVMSGVPKSKAGIASAVNDATREVGGALGIGILGSLLISGFRDRLVLPASLPAAVGDIARDSLGVALEVARRIGGEQGTELAEAAREAFLGALRPTYLVGAGVLFAAAILAFVFVPRGAEAARRASGALVQDASTLAARPAPRTRAAGVTLAALLVVLVLASGSLAASLATAPARERAELPPPPVVESHEVGGRVQQVNGLPTGSVATTPDAQMHVVATNVTTGRVMVKLFWENAAQGAAALRVQVESNANGTWSLVAEGAGPSGFEVITPVVALGDHVRVFVWADAPGFVEQPYGGVVLVASPEVPLPPPAEDASASRGQTI